VEDQPTPGGRRVQRLLEAPEAHVPILQLPHQVDELPQGAPQPVELRYHKDVALTAVIEGFAQRLPVGLPAGDLFEDPIAAVRQERVALRLEPLILP
jgi:hypothetical protein